MNNSECDFRQLMHHITKWFAIDLARYIKCSTTEATKLMYAKLSNNYYADYEITPAGFKWSADALQWIKAQSTERGRCDLISKGYLRRVHNSIPSNIDESLDKFMSVLHAAAREVYRDGYYWIFDFQDTHGHWLGDWIELKKPIFKRVFDKMWKKEKREDRKWAKLYRLDSEM